MKISDYPGIQPKGFLVRLPFYVLAARDAHIVFSPTEQPNWTRDNVYEIRKKSIQQKKKKKETNEKFDFQLLADGEIIVRWFDVNDKISIWLQNTRLMYCEKMNHWNC